MKHITDDHDALLDYLYEEGDPDERLAIAKHLQECAACAVGVLEFQNVRGMLSDWVPPASSSRNTPVTFPSSMAYPGSVDTSPRRRFGGFAQAAAAVLIFAAGMAVSQIHVEYRDGVVTLGTPTGPTSPGPGIRTGWIHLSPQAPASLTPVDHTPSAADTEQLLQRVRAMIDQSEQRQQNELALRLSQVTREVDTQHQADLMRIQQDFGRQQDATMDLIVRTSGGVK